MFLRFFLHPIIYVLTPVGIIARRHYRYELFVTFVVNYVLFEHRLADSMLVAMVSRTRLFAMVTNMVAMVTKTVAKVTLESPSRLPRP